VIGFQRSCATLCVGVLLMSVSGCTSSSDDELARSRDLASYGCALVSHLENGAAVESWELLPGLDADSPTTSATAVVGLLGGMSGTSLEGYGKLYRDAGRLFSGLRQQDAEVIQSALDDLAATCAKRSLASGDVDTSIEGRIDFACRLVTDIRTTDAEVQRWIDAVGTDRPGALLLTEAYAVVTLLGGATASPLPGRPVLTQASQDLFMGLRRPDAAQIAEELTEIKTLCDG